MKNLSDDELLKNTKETAEKEKFYTLKLLEHLVEVERRGLHLKRAFSSLFDYCVRGLGYSEMEASHRVNASRLITSMPEVKENLEKKELTLTSASKLQQFFKAKSKLKIPLKKKEKLSFINQALNQSSRNVEKLIAKELPQQLSRESETRISEQFVRLNIIVDDETLQLLEEYKNLKGNKQTGEILKEALKNLLKKPKLKPIRKTKPSNPKKRYVPLPIKQNILKKSEYQCEYIDLLTNKRCPSKYCLEIDHKKPFSKKGLTEITNLQVLCRAHNLWKGAG